jgi:hypothetical protein
MLATATFLSLIALAVATFYAVPSVAVAAVAVLVACAVGLGAPGTPAACAATGVYLGALVRLLAAGMRHVGLAQPAVMATAVVVLLLAGAVHVRKGSDDKKNVLPLT